MLSTDLNGILPTTACRVNVKVRELLEHLSSCIRTVIDQIVRRVTYISSAVDAQGNVQLGIRKLGQDTGYRASSCAPKQITHQFGPSY